MVTPLGGVLPSWGRGHGGRGCCLQRVAPCAPWPGRAGVYVSLRTSVMFPSRTVYAKSLPCRPDLSLLAPVSGFCFLRRCSVGRLGISDVLLCFPTWTGPSGGPDTHRGAQSLWRGPSRTPKIQVHKVSAGPSCNPRESSGTSCTRRRDARGGTAEGLGRWHVGSFQKSRRVGDTIACLRLLERSAPRRGVSARTGAGAELGPRP